MDLSNLCYLFAGWLLSQLGSWLKYKRETPADIRNRTWERSSSYDMTPKAWDYLFSDGCCYWIKITLNNGLIISGKYSTKSFASSYPHDEDIYLEDIWIHNEGENYSEHQQRGALIERKNIVLMEIHPIEEGDEHGD